MRGTWSSSAREGSGRSRRWLLATGTVVAVLAASVATAQAATFSADATVSDPAQYVGDTVGVTYTATVRNTGSSTTIGAVELTRPSTAWTIVSCPVAPSGWTATRTASTCTYASAPGAAGNLAVGASSSAFQAKATTAPGTQDALGMWKVRVSRTSTFAVAADVTTATNPAPYPYLDARAYSLEIRPLMILSGSPAQGSACPAPAAGAKAGSLVTLVACGRVRATTGMTPVATSSSVTGPFVGVPGTFHSGPLVPAATEKVIAVWTNTRVSSTVSPAADVLMRLGASSAKQSAPRSRPFAVTDARPVAASQSRTTTQDVPVTVTLSATDGDGDDTTASIASGPTHGTLGPLAPQPCTGTTTRTCTTTVTYTPDAGYQGGDSFTWTATDGYLTSTPGTVSLTVSPPPNAAPTANDDTGTTDEDTATSPDIDVLANDTDPDGDTLHIASVTQPAHGATTIVSGKVHYAPDTAYWDSLAPGGSGTDPFTYKAADPGGAQSGSATVTVTVTGVNDAPRLVATSGSASYTEGGSAVAVDPTLGLTDPDDANLESAQVSVSSGFQAGDTLGFVNTAGITGSYNSGTGVLTLAGTDTVAAYRTALRSVDFSTSNDNPTSSRTVSFSAGDGTATGGPVARGVTISATDDAPVVTTTGGSTAYTEGDAPVVVDSGVDVSDPDDTELVGARVQVTGNYVSGQDVLDFANAFGVSKAGFNAATGTLTLTGTASLADYRDALRTVTYENPSEAPSSVARTISFVVDDGTLESAAGTKTVTVTPVNDAPVVEAGTGQASWTEGSTAVAVAPALTVSDVDDADLESATVRIRSTTFVPGDDLQFVNQNGISGSYNLLTGVLTLTGTATVTQYRDALRSVAFSSSSPAPGSTTRTVEFTVNDGTDDSNTDTRDVAVNDVNSAPVVTTSAGPTAFTEDGGPVVVDPGVTVTDGDSADLASATVSVTTNHESSDLLLFTNTATISGVFSGGTLTLTGVDTVAAYQAALRSVTFDSTSDTPSALPRTVEFAVDDGEATNSASNVASKTVTVTPANDPPVVGLSASTPTFTEDGPAVVVDAGLTVTDPDSASLTGATVSITSGLRTGDVLAATVSPPLVASYDSPTGVLTITGASTPATYQAALRTVTFGNSSEDPGTSRQLSFIASDGTTGPAAVKTVGVTAVNDAPVLSPPGEVTFTENGTSTPAAGDAVAVAPDLEVTDADSTSLTGATVSIASGFASAEDVLAFTPTGAVTGSYNSATGTLTLSGTDTLATYRSALRSVTYRDTSNAPSTTDRTVTFVVTDGTTPSAGLDRTVHVTAVNDAPAATDKTFNGVNEAVSNTTLVLHDAANSTHAVTGPAKTISGNLLTGSSDPDGPGPLVVQASSGQSTSAGGTVDLYADGDFAYHPQAGDANVDDTFSYTVEDQGGGTTTKTVTVHVNADTTWYVQSGAPAVGADGTSDNPFPSLVGVNGVGGSGDVDTTGQRIFLYPGTYTGGLPLEGSQKLQSKRHGLVVPDGSGGAGTVTLEAPGGTSTEIDGGLVLAGGNTIQGIDLGTTGAAAVFALSGFSVGNLVMNTGTTGGIINPAGGAVSINGGNLDVALSTLTSAGASGSAVSLTGSPTGTFTVNGSGTISGATGTDVLISGGTLAFTLGSSIADDNGQLVSITGQTAGTKDFNGLVSDAPADGDGGGISLSSNTGATVRFDGGVALSTGTNDAFKATGGGTVAVTGTTNVVASTTGTAVTVTDTTISSDEVTFQSVSSNGAARGIFLSNTGTVGHLAVLSSGSGTCINGVTTGCSGGVIQSGTGADDSGATPPGSGIVLFNTTAPIFNRMYLHDFSNYAVRGTTVNGFTLQNSVVSGVNGTNDTDPFDDGSLRFNELTGSALVSSSYVAGGYQDNLSVENTTGTLDRLTVSGSTFGPNSATGGSDGIFLESGVGTTSSLKATVTGSTFTGSRGDHVQVNVAGNSGGDFVFTGNLVSNSMAGGAGTLAFSGGNAGTTTMDVENNTIRDGDQVGLKLVKSGGTGTLTALVNGNTIGVAAVADSGSKTGSGFSIDQRGGGAANLTLTNNSIRQYNNMGIDLQAGGGVAGQSGQLNVAVSGNTVSNPGTNPALSVASYGLHVNSGTGVGDTFATCVNIGTNSITGSARNTGVGGTDFRFRQRQSTTVKLVSSTGGYAGANTDTTAVTFYIQSKLGGAPTGSSSVSSPPGGGFTGGGTSCP
jgi:Bacterial Ig domain